VNRWTVLALTLVNFVLLVPGVTLPIYSVDITTEVTASIVPEPVEVTIYQQTRSIVGVVRELWQSADYLVSFLILLFSIIVPVSKGSILVASVFAVKDAVRKRLVLLVDLIGKWSMADVFLVAVFLAYLATRDQPRENSFAIDLPIPLLNQITVDMQTRMTSSLEPGFYWFLGYCLFSVAWTQFLRHRQPV
jgi:uncharacterized paraquat-inducible protein A